MSEGKDKGLHRKIYPYTKEVLQYANEREGQDPWVVENRSTATRNERRGFGRAVVRKWIPGGWTPVIPQGEELAWTTIVTTGNNEIEVTPIKMMDGTTCLELGVWNEGDEGRSVVLEDPAKVRQLAESLLEVASRMEGR